MAGVMVQGHRGPSVVDLVVSTARGVPYMGSPKTDPIYYDPHERSSQQEPPILVNHHIFGKNCCPTYSPCCSGQAELLMKRLQSGKGTLFQGLSHGPLVTWALSFLEGL